LTTEEKKGAIGTEEVGGKSRLALKGGSRKMGGEESIRRNEILLLRKAHKQNVQQSARYGGKREGHSNLDGVSTLLGRV